jgi:ABC-type bacteriocin/lantibiotic exporter with double-glycine peptidase domain
MSNVVDFVARGALLTVVVLVNTITCLTRVQAQVPSQVLDQAYLPIQIEPQQTLEWCWVASARMVARYFSKQTPSQCAMLQEQYGAPCCADPQSCTVPGSIFQVQQLIRSFGLKASLIGPPTNGYVLLALFKQNHPIVIHLVQGHFAVASGIKVVATPAGPLGIVHILDPFYGIQDVPLPTLYQQWDGAVYVE